MLPINFKTLTQFYYLVLLTNYYLNLTLLATGGGGGGLRGPDDNIISCHSKTPNGTAFKLGDF